MQQPPQRPAWRPARSILFLEGPSPIFDGESVEIAPDFWLAKTEPSFLEELKQEGVADIDSLATGCSVYVHFWATDAPNDLMRPMAFQRALILATDVRSQEKTQVIFNPGQANNATATQIPARGSIQWGHFRKELSLNDIESAKKLLPRVEPLQLADQFSRVGNALLFYGNGFNSDNPDLALVAFTTCLESLFSTAEQELSFRLSLRVATFLADGNGERQELFQQCKEVYKIRSKVVHGAAIHKDPERAAVYLVEGIIPDAERLARRCLAKVFEIRLESLFENASKLNSLFDRLLFSDSLEETIRESR